ncbi:MAG TPA: hypothetical protein VMW80_08180 [Candidatus Dormibacteraeota bacterium]|nr:hypothetical protein [Candidatus Dormibacteraeota bacterium]
MVGDDADLPAIEARLEKLLPEITRRYWQCVSWAVAAFGLMLLTLLAAFLITAVTEPAKVIVVAIGCVAALLALSRAWLLMFQLLPLNRERNRLRLARLGPSPP